MLVAASDGTLAADIRPLVRLNVSVILENNGRREQGYAGGGARADLTGTFSKATCAESNTRARRCVRRWCSSRPLPAPAGTMPVVLGPGWPGVLLHEAVGHGLEGDFNRKGTSAFSGRVGQQVASDRCARSSTTARFRIAAVRWPSMTRARRASTTCWSRTAFCAATCRTSSTRD